MNRKPCQFALIMVVMGSLSGYAEIPVEADDFEHDVVGTIPTKPTELNPSAPAAGASAGVVNEAANMAGAGKGLRLQDSDSGTAVHVQYEFTRIADDPPDATIPNGLVSAVRVDLSFAPLSSTGTRGDFFTVAFGEFGADLNLTADRIIQCRLWDDGTIDFVSGSGPDSTGHGVLAAANTLTIFANDKAQRITYTGPDSNPYVLPADAVAYWLNGSRIAFGGQGYTSLENRSTANGTIFTSALNIGRFGIVSSASAVGLDYVFDDILLTDLDSEQRAVHTSWLVSEGPLGLVYTGYANEGQTQAVNTVPDFSSAGYKGGGVPIPFVPAAVMVSPGPGDDRAAIQGAINHVSALSVGPDGFRGAVLLEAGDYEVSSTLTISASGVVIRGAGSQENGGTRITFTYAGTEKPALFEVNGGSVSPSELGGTRRDITDSYVPVGATSFTISNASGYAPGDRIMVQTTVNQQWLLDLSDMTQYGWNTSSYSIPYRRTVTAIDGNTMTIDAPVVQTLEDAYGGGDVYRYAYPGELENIGFECLRLESAYASDTDDDHGWKAVVLEDLKNGWVRQVTARYFVNGAVGIPGYSSHITVEDCAMLDYKATTKSGRRYSFSLGGEASNILVQRCLTRRGRHDFATGSQTPGPNAFVDCRATETINDVGPHHRYSTGELYDNVMGGEINVQNRTTSGSGHGWAGAQVMFWNCDGASIVCDAPNGAMNWCVGSTAVKRDSHRSPWEPFGIWDSHNHAVTPRSLYYTQLADRLGMNALNTVILPQQKAGNIWAELFLWDGNGVFLDDVVVWADKETDPQAGQPLAVHGILRNLPMLDRGATYAWSTLSGPGTVAFGDDTALETTATFSQEGLYVLALSVDDGVSPVSNRLTVVVGEGGPDTEPPAVPSGLGASAASNVVRLNWDENGEADLDSYSVFRSTTSGTFGAVLATGLTASAYMDHAVINGSTYYYAVTAVDIHTLESVQSAEVSATPKAVSSPSEAVAFGSDHDGYAGFTTSTENGQQSWSLQTDRVQYTNDGSVDGGTENSSLLKSFTLDRSVGNRYTLQGVIGMTNGYADDNNRVGLYLFGDSAEILNEDETGAIGLIFNTDDGFTGGAPGDNADDDTALRVGIDSTNLSGDVPRNESGTVAFAQDLFGTEITLRADVTFTNIGGVDAIQVVGSLTDVNDVTTTVGTTVPAADYTGDYFGFVTRARNRGTDTRNRPWIMDYRSFSISRATPLTGYALWTSAWGTEIGGSAYDFDHDGSVNLLEYGLDGNPIDALDQGTRPTLANAGDAFLYVYPRRADDNALIYTVETSTDLVSGTWTDHGYTVAGTNVTGGVLDVVTNEVDAAHDSLFIRLKIAQ